MLTHWSYIFLALTHWHIPSYTFNTILWYKWQEYWRGLLIFSSFLLTKRKKCFEIFSLFQWTVFCMLLFQPVSDGCLQYFLVEVICLKFTCIVHIHVSWYIYIHVLCLIYTAYFSNCQYYVAIVSTLAKSWLIIAQHQRKTRIVWLLTEQNLANPNDLFMVFWFLCLWYFVVLCFNVWS